MNCEFCQSPVHIWFQCPKKPDGWKPARLAKKSRGEGSAQPKPSAPVQSRTSRAKSTAARKDVLSGELRRMEAMGPTPSVRMAISEAGTQALPVDTKFNKKEWMKLYMREHRRGLRRRAK